MAFVTNLYIVAIIILSLFINIYKGIQMKNIIEQNSLDENINSDK